MKSRILSSAFALLIAGAAVSIPVTANAAEMTGEFAAPTAVVTLPDPGKGCYWVEDGYYSGPTSSPLYKKFGYRDKTGRNDSAVLAKIPDGASITFEWCGGQGWTRVVYKGQLGWIYGKPCGPTTTCYIKTKSV